MFIFIFLLCGLKKHRRGCAVFGAAVKGKNVILDLEEMQRGGGEGTYSAFSSLKRKFFSFFLMCKGLEISEP